MYPISKVRSKFVVYRDGKLLGERGLIFDHRWLSYRRRAKSSNRDEIVRTRFFTRPRVKRATPKR